jgi:enoyl-CoA hydratase/carnithine racemase
LPACSRRELSRVSLVIEMGGGRADHSARADRSVRLMLLHGADDAFCNGNDLQDFLAIRRTTTRVPAAVLCGSSAELLAVATAAAEKLADKPPGALKIAKQLLRRALMPQIDAALEEESKQFRALLRSPEAKEAFTAFFEKRKGDFSKVRLKLKE